MNEKLINTDNDIIIYTDDDGNINVEVLLKEENVWLNTKSIAKLFHVDRTVITKHINNIYKDGELDRDNTCAIFAHMGNNGQQTYKTKYYNLDMIISVGFRTNSKKAIKFRTWANKILKDYIIQGFALNDKRFLKGDKADQKYFDRLLERIKLIRTSERMAYQKITDIFVDCSIDYDKKSEEAYSFFKIVQNKLHYAITGKTAAELIFERVDSEKINMGLTIWEDAPDGKILKYDIGIAKNYLLKDELEKLNNLTNLFLDIAEDEAREQKVMTMQDWIGVTDDLLQYRKKNVLKDAGSISHKQAVDKANKEYEKFRIRQDQEYISSMDEMYEKYLEESKN